MVTFELVSFVLLLSGLHAVAPPDGSLTVTCTLLAIAKDVDLGDGGELGGGAATEREVRICVNPPPAT